MPPDLDRRNENSDLDVLAPDPSHTQPLALWPGTESGVEGAQLQQERLEDGRVLSWRELEHPELQRSFFTQLWEDVCELRLRYRLPVRSRWWEDEIQVEALAALAAWVRRFDQGEWEDPPGKLSLLFELDRVEALLRDGHDPLDPRRDRPNFDAFLQQRVFDRRPAVG